MILPKALQPNLVGAYGNAREVTSIGQLDDIISDPDAMRMQALLVRERILGPAHPDTSYYIRYRGAVYADTGNFERCITLWMYALEMQQKILEPLSPMTQSSFVSFAELFSFMMNEANNKSPRVPLVNFDDMMAVFYKCLDEIEIGMGQISKLASGLLRTGTSGSSSTNPSAKANNSSIANNTSSTSSPNACHGSNGERDCTYFHRTLVITLHLLCLINKLTPLLSSTQIEALNRAVYRLVKLDPAGNGGATPLHLACAKETASTVGRFPICGFPNRAVVSLLLEAGAKPDARDNEGNTPLHTLGANKSASREIVLALLKGGAHLDTLNNSSQTFESLRANRHQQIHQVVNSVQFTSLQCLCARSLRRHRIPYENTLPRTVSKFVDLH